MPLAVALLSISNPTVGVMDMLSRLSHDSDQEVAQNAILALGIAPYPSVLKDRLGYGKEISVRGSHINDSQSLILASAASPYLS